MPISNVAEGYVENSLINKKMIAQKILMGEDTEKENRPSTSSSLNQVDICVPINNTDRLKSLFTISGGSNINVNIK